MKEEGVDVENRSRITNDLAFTETRSRITYHVSRITYHVARRVHVVAANPSWLAYE